MAWVSIIAAIQHPSKLCSMLTFLLGRACFAIAFDLQVQQSINMECVQFDSPGQT